MKQNTITNTELPLADIHLPEAIDFWPPAIGWWLLLLVVIVVLFICIRWGYQRVRAHQKKWGYRRVALKLLDDEFHAMQTQPHQAPTPLLRVLKRTAMSAYPDQHIQGLYGQAWMDCLNRQTEKNYFGEHFYAMFYQQQYQNNSVDTTKGEQTDTDVNTTTQNQQLYQAIKQWINNHRVEFTVVDPSEIEANHV